MITFTDGTEISWEGAAVLVEAEGRLIHSPWRNAQGERCAAGVLEEWTGVGRFRSRGIIGAAPIIKANEAFVGTPEARAVYMAGWLRKQDKETLEVT